MNPQKVEKPWGHEVIWAKTDHYVGKILHIRRGQRLSYQYHRRKDETILLIQGRLELTVHAEGEAPENRHLSPGESVHIPPRIRHRMRAIEDCDVVEVSTPELDDVVRIQDDYGRADRP